MELFVPKDRPHQIERRIHALVGSTVPMLVRNVNGADRKSRRAWSFEPSPLDSERPVENPDVVFDSGSGTRVAFKVSHRTFRPQADPGRTRYPQLFDPGVFKVEVAVAIDKSDETVELHSWPSKENWETLREEMTELRIPSVRQN